MSTSESTNKTDTPESTPPVSAGTPAAADTTPAESLSPTESLGPLSEDRVREALKTVVDPELFVNIVDLGLIYTVELADGEDDKSNITIEMTLTSPACPAGPQIIGQSKDAVSRLDTVGEVEIKLVMDPPWTPDRMTEDARDQLGIF